MTDDGHQHDPTQHDPTQGDSAGQTWSGRALTSTGFDHDTGAADPTLLALLGDLAADVAPDPARSSERTTALLAAIAGARLLVPVVAEPGELDTTGDLTVEKSTDMAAVTLVAPDGTRALPVFTSIASLAAWDAQARPVPVTAARAGQAAVVERCDVMVLDLAEAHSVTLRPSMVWALAQERPWAPAHTDPVVARSVEAAVAAEPSVFDHGLAEGEPAGHGILTVVLELVPGLAAADVQDLATRIGERLATDGELRARIDGLAFTIR